MTIPKRMSELLEDQRSEIRIFANTGTMRYKTGGLFDGLLVEAMHNDERIGYLTAEKRHDGNYVMDGVFVEPDYRQNGIATEMVRKAHSVVPMTPYILTDNQVYQSDIGKKIAENEYRMVTASMIVTAGPLLAIPEVLGAEALAGAGAGALDTAAVGGAVADTAATATADAAAGAESTIGSETGSNAIKPDQIYGPGEAPPINTGEAGAGGGSSGGSSLWQRAKGFASDQWNRFSPNQQKAIKALAPGASSAAGSELSKGSGPGGSPGSVPTQGPYGGGTGGGQPVRVAPMLVGASKKANTETQILSEVNNMSRMLELILENLCGCGEPTDGKFEGMPHLSLIHI